MAKPRQLGALSITPTQPYVRPRVKQDKPAYGVISTGFYDNNDKFWNPGEALYFAGEPNLNLIPLNKMAYDRIQTFLDKLDELAEKKCKKDGVAFVPQARTEWSETDVESDFPTPEYVMGMQKKEVNEAVR